MLQLCYCATFVETPPIAQTYVEFYDIAHFLSKTTPFYKKLPPFYKKKLQITSLEKTPTSHISLYKKTKFSEIIETPVVISAERSFLMISQSIICWC